MAKIDCACGSERPGFTNAFAALPGWPFFSIIDADGTKLELFNAFDTATGEAWYTVARDKNGKKIEAIIHFKPPLQAIPHKD